MLVQTYVEIDFSTIKEFTPEELANPAVDKILRKIADSIDREILDELRRTN